MRARDGRKDDMRRSDNSHNDGTFDPDQMMARVDQLQVQDKLPAPEEFLRALAEAVIEQEQETQRKARRRKHR